MTQTKPHSFSPSSEPFTQGLLQIYTGDGKGKTTAALGMVIRALGHGLRVCVIAFMKGNYDFGEWRILAQLPGVKIARFGLKKLVDPHNVKPSDLKQVKLAMEAAREALRSHDYDLIVLDEINLAVAWNLIQLDDVVQLVSEKQPNVELILTGRYADEKLCEIADLVTVCLNIKHPYDKGILARAGIDY